MTPTETEALRRAAVERVARLQWLARALLAPQCEASRVMLCAEAARELQSIAEGTRVSPDAPMDPEGR